MIRAIIIEDEPKSMKTLQHMLEEHCKEVYVVATANSVDTGVEAIINTRPDLIFLDISLSDESGFQVLKRVPASFGFHVIFTTAYKEYGIEAVKASALEYLLKPIDAEELKAAVNKYEQKTSLNYIQKQLKKMEDSGGRARERISLPTSDGLMVVETAHIVRIQASGSYTVFFLKDGSQHMVSRNMKEFEDQLTSTQLFRVHDSHIVNLDYVVKYVKGRGGHLVLKDGTTIEVSVRRKQKVLSILEG